MKLGNLYLWLFSLLLLTSCTKSPTDARKELVELDVPFEKAACLEYTEKQDKTVIDLFLASDISPECILIGASETGNLELVKQALSEGADPNVILDDELQGIENSQALCRAAYRGHEEIVDILLENGAIPDSNYLFTSCSKLAQNRGHTEITKKLEKAIVKWQQETLVGLWSGAEKYPYIDDYWEIKRDNDGTFTRKFLSIDHKEKTYSSSFQVGEWKISDKRYEEKVLSNDDEDISVPAPFEFMVLGLQSDKFQYKNPNGEESFFGFPETRAKEEKIDKSKPLPSIPDGYTEEK